jgi:predicted enzyme related to lactoylglutathione lyase
MPARYRMVNEGRGGLWDTSEIGAASWAIFYVQVEDVHDAIGRAQELGATVAVAHLTDPQGNRFGIWRPKAAQ